jgi:hypothetical protein
VSKWHFFMCHIVVACRKSEKYKNTIFSQSEYFIFYKYLTLLQVVSVLMFSWQNLVSLLIKDNADQQVPYTFKRCLEADVVRYIQQNFRADKTLPWKVCCCNTTGNLLAGRCVDPEFWKMLENSSGEQFKCFIEVSFGTFGHCNWYIDLCSPSTIAYWVRKSRPDQKPGLEGPVR